MTDLGVSLCVVSSTKVKSGVRRCDMLQGPCWTRGEMKEIAGGKAVFVQEARPDPEPDGQCQCQRQLHRVASNTTQAESTLAHSHSVLSKEMVGETARRRA